MKELTMVYSKGRRLTSGRSLEVRNYFESSATKEPTLHMICGNIAAQ